MQHRTLVGSALSPPAAWSSGTNYSVGDLAIRANALFICIQAHTNHDPFTDCATVLSGTYWQFFSLRGAVESYNSGVGQVSSTSLSAPNDAPDQVTVYCPGGILFWEVAAQWKLTGSPLAASSAQTQIDGAALQAGAVNAGSNAGGSVALAVTGVFWGILFTPAAPSVGGLASAPSASADANVIAQPYSPSIGNNPLGLQANVGVGVHTVGILYAAGNGTTTVNVRDRRLKVFGQ